MGGLLEEGVTALKVAQVLELLIGVPILHLDTGPTAFPFIHSNLNRLPFGANEHKTLCQLP